MSQERKDKPSYKPPYGGVMPPLILPDGTRKFWLGDESSGCWWPSGCGKQSPAKRAPKLPAKYRSFWDLFGKGWPE